MNEGILELYGFTEEDICKVFIEICDDLGKGAGYDIVTSKLDTNLLKYFATIGIIALTDCYIKEYYENNKFN